MGRFSLIILAAEIMSAIAHALTGTKYDGTHFIVIWLLLDSIEQKHEAKDKAFAKSLLDIWRK
jgi:hypothetical protein